MWTSPSSWKISATSSSERPHTSCKRPANDTNDTNGQHFIRLICVIRGPKSPIERTSSQIPSATCAAPDFDLALTLECGQVFHWQREGAGWLGTIGDRAIYIE